jgi:predicted lipid-binding transport protein (Tim44 family)
MSRFLSRFFAVALMTLGGVALTAVTLEAQAARAGSGTSSGKQSSNVSSQKPATPAAATGSTTQKSATAPAAAAPAAAAAAKPSGASRWLGPLAGIAAGLGIAAMLSHFGLGGAMGDFLMVALLAAVAIFGVLFVIRMIRGSSAQPAAQGAGAGTTGGAQTPANEMYRETAAPAAAPVALPASATGSMSAAGFGSDAPAPDQNWFIPVDFDTNRFLQEAKAQFVSIQKVWDSGDLTQMRNFLTEDLLKELQAQLSGRVGENHTEVVVLNAEMLGIEKVTDGHLASVRFSGMLREQVGAEAFRFEEVWNLFKPEQGGWLLAGIQQIPVTHAS